jgi:divalent metal cation (Fe/Co/Zn/Cd) transporter
VRTILVALASNVVVAVAKLVAGLLSGSAAMLAEAGHSLADSLNEIFLGISLRRSRRPADLAHPLGHGRERFLWAFMAAIASFLVGGCLSVAPAVEEVLALQAVYTGPEEVIVAAKVRPAARLTVDALARAMDEIDHALRAALPVVADVYIDVTAYRSETAAFDGASQTERASEGMDRLDP